MLQVLFVMWRRASQHLGTFIAAVLILTALHTPSSAEDNSDWSGRWETFWRDGAAIIELQQDGGNVTGTYEPGGGQIEAQVDGSILRGRWLVDGVGGRLTFALADDGQTFTGRFDTGEFWNGRRLDDRAAQNMRPLSDGSPRETLQSVVALVNDFLVGSQVEALRAAQGFLVFEGEANDSRALNRRRALLWNIIDLSTFRLYDAPPRPTGDTASFTIGLDGTAATYDLQFDRNAAGGWRLLVEDEETLNGTLQGYLAALGVPNVAAAQAALAVSPRGTMQRFLNGTHTWDGQGRAEAIASLDLSYLPDHLHSAEGPLLADYLKNVLDRAGFVFFQEIPNNPARTTPYVHYAHPVGDIVISRVAGQDDETEDRWVFNAESLRNLPELYYAMQNLPVDVAIEESVPLTQFFALRAKLRELSPSLVVRVGLLETWQWLGILLLAIAAFVLSALVGRLVPNTSVIAEDEEVGPIPSQRSGFVRSGQLMLGSLLFVWGLNSMGILQTSLAGLHTLAASTAVIGGTWFAILLTGRIGAIFQSKAEATIGYTDEIVTAMAVGIIKLVILVAGLLLIAEIINLPYEGVLAGLGVGGIALAFAARETVSNVLGGLLLLTDRPFRRGDLIETRGELATVETVGIRSTRLKRLDDTVMIIPNAQLSDHVIVNWGMRSRRRVDVSIALTYNTPRELLDKFVCDLKSVILRQPQIDNDDIYVGLKDFGASAIEIECRCFFRVQTYDEQVVARSALVADIIDVAKETGVHFAFPTRTIQIEKEA